MMAVANTILPTEFPKAATIVHGEDEQGKGHDSVDQPTDETFDLAAKKAGANQGQH